MLEEILNKILGVYKIESHVGATSVSRICVACGGLVVKYSFLGQASGRY